MKKKTLTPVSAFHYFRLVYRSLLFLALLIAYLIHRIKGTDDITGTLERQPLIIYVICSVFILEMILRFFPSRLESPGCQKQFAQNYIK